MQSFYRQKNDACLWIAADSDSLMGINVVSAKLILPAVKNVRIAKNIIQWRTFLHCRTNRFCQTKCALGTLSLCRSSPTCYSAITEKRSFYTTLQMQVLANYAGQRHEKA